MFSDENENTMGASESEQPSYDSQISAPKEQSDDSFANPSYPPPPSYSSAPPNPYYYRMPVDPNPNYYSPYPYNPYSGMNGTDNYEAERLARKKEWKNVFVFSNIVGAGLLLFCLSSVLSAFLMAMAAFIVGMSSDELTLDFFYGTQTGLLINMVAYFFTMTVPFLLLMLFSKTRFSAVLRFRPQSKSLTFLALPLVPSVAVVGVLMAGIVTVLLALFGLQPSYPDIPAPTDPTTFVLYFIMIAVFPAFLEEFAFRGVLMQSLRRFGDGFALVVSSIIFAAMHGNIAQSAAVFFLGLTMGFFVLRTGSLWVGILMHFINNALSIGMEVTLRDMSNEKAGMLIFLFYAAMVLLGIAFLVLLLVRREKVFTLKDRTRLSVSKKVGIFFISPTVILTMIFFIVEFFSSVESLSTIL